MGHQLYPQAHPHAEWGKFTVILSSLQGFQGVTLGEPFQKDVWSGSSRPDPDKALGVGPAVLVSGGREGAERLS